MTAKRLIVAVLILGSSAILGVTGNAQEKNPDQNEGVGQTENIVASGEIDRRSSCPGDGCNDELSELIGSLVGMWQTDVTDFANAPPDDPRGKATKHVHIMRLVADGTGVFDASPNSGETWCRSAFIWAAESVSEDESITINRVFTEDSTCKRLPPGAAKPLFARFVTEAHNEALNGPLPTIRIRGRSNSWNEPVRVYYHMCNRDPLSPSEVCTPLKWRPDVHVGKMHAQNIEPWRP